MLVVKNTTVANAAVLVTDRNRYRVSRGLKTIQYLLFQDIVRDWNDKLLYIESREDTLVEIERMGIDNRILN